jgi:glycosyltransferase involved in cell wall biosynthesis
VDKPGWQRWLDRRTAFIADRVVVNAEDVMRSAIRKEGVRKEQIVYIPNGVGSMAPGKSRESMRASLGIPANAKVIGAVGRLHASKGHDVLVAAFARLAAEMPDAYLAIAGDGGLRGRLEQQIADLRLAGRAHLLGVRDDIPDLLGAMDIFAHPSRWEGMPNALMEAMAAGLPVVASSVDGIKTLIRDNETGILVKSGAIGDLAAQLRRLILDDGFAMQLGRRAAQEMKEQFGLDRMCDAYDTLYRNLLRQKTVRIAGKGEP